MKIKWTSIWLWVAGFLGISSCTNINIGVVEYGCPYADYNYDIVVTDNDGKPIANIQASTYEGGPSVAASDKDGHVVFQAQLPVYIPLCLTDIDGPENGGEFQSKTISKNELNFKQVKGGEHWYEGEFEVTGTVQLEKK